MEIRCGDCGAPLAAESTVCEGCGRILGSKPATTGRPKLFVWAAIAAAVEVALTLVIMRGCR